MASELWSEIGKGLKSNRYANSDSWALCWSKHDGIQVCRTQIQAIHYQEEGGHQEIEVKPVEASLPEPVLETKSEPVLETKPEEAPVAS